MPQVAVSANLKFTNHWIGIYAPGGRNLIPSRHSAQLQPAPADDLAKVILPADPYTLLPVYTQALAERERQSGPDSVAAKRAASDLGLFLLELNRNAEAEAPLRRAQAGEALARSLDAQGKRDEAIALLPASSRGPASGRVGTSLRETRRNRTCPGRRSL